MLAGIDYTTFPDIALGPVTLRTFGTLVAAGILFGIWWAGRYLEQFDIDRDEVYALATRMVLWGVVGSRITWVLTHLDQIDNPIDVIAVWEGGIQFSGGFITALLVAYPTMRHWPRPKILRTMDGYAYGLTAGLAIGRVGCYSVGEHFGSVTSFALGTTYRGGSTQEDFLGDTPLVEGMTFHNTALYEFAHLAVLFAILAVVVRRAGGQLRTGLITAIFMVWYGVGRFSTDIVRVNDSRVLGLTGAQWMCVVLVPAGIWLFWRSRSVAEPAPDAPATT